MPNKKPLATIDEVFITLKSLVRQMNRNFKRVDRSFEEVYQELKLFRNETNKRFDKQEKLFFDWKSDLFNKIDKGYAKPIKDLQEEDDAQLLRLESHEKRIAKLEKPVFASS